jgi:DNA-binding NarL/FixJ family response regulator
MFRKGLASLINSNTGMEVVGEAADGMEAVVLAQRLSPDVILMDIRMPGCNGLQATRLIKAQDPKARIIILTVSEEEDDLFEAIKSGAQGYVLKNMSPEALFEALEAVVRGEAPLSPAMGAKLLEEFKRLSQEHTVAGPLLLSPRERQILEYIAAGAGNKEIANNLGIAPGTVKNHIHNILEKLHAQNRAQAVAQAIREGLIPPQRGF